MKRKDSVLFAETRSVEKIIVRTSWPCAVPKPVRTTTPRQPPSGVFTGDGISPVRCKFSGSSQKINKRVLDWVACKIFVPLKRTAFLCAPSTSRFSEASKSCMDSFNKGVDSPESIASLTIQVPLIKSMSAGTVVSVWTRATKF